MPGGLQIEPGHLAGDIGSAMYVQPAEVTVATRSTPEGISLREEVRRFQIELIRAALAKHGGNWAAAARALDMNRSNLHNLATRLGIRDRGQ
jgi:anaerobic nitric oxide reductase transcription regulator